MGRGSGISIRDRLIVWNSICKGINSATLIKKIFDDTDEREISVDSIRRLIKEFEDFKRLLPEYPDLTEELKDMVAGEGIIHASYFNIPWKYTCPTAPNPMSGKLVGAIVKNEGTKTLEQVHANLVIGMRSIRLGWVEEAGEFIDISPASEKHLGIVNTMEPNDELYERILSWRYPQVMGASSRTLPHREGCWVASPGALSIPAPGDIYLTPGEHQATLFILYGGGKEFSQELKLLSPQSWDGLGLQTTNFGVE